MRVHPLVAFLTLSLPLGLPLHAQNAAPRPSTATPAPSPRDWNLRQTPVVDVVRRVKGAVVNIHSERTVRATDADVLFNLTPSQNRVNGMGTGIVLDARGLIITNQHVVDDVSSLKVRLADGTNLDARVVARDTESDLALLSIQPPRPLPVMPLGTARDLQVGETVLAIGNAYGYDHTVTLGIVSALGRDVTLNRDVRYKSLIQTDASINPGNSGGPLINLHGELVGVNVAIRAGAQGIGFAIPVDTMIQVGARLLAGVHARNNLAPPGLLVHDAIQHTAASRHVVVDRADGAAARAGLRPGDVVQRIGDLPVRNSLDVQRGLLGSEPGQRVPVVVRRGDKEHTLELTLLAQRPPVNATLVSRENPSERLWQRLGLRLGAVPNLAEVTRGHPQLHGGLLIAQVKEGSPASRAGLRPGDVLVGLHQWEMLTLDNVLFVLDHPDRLTFSPLRFFILRSGQVHSGKLILPD